MTVNMYIVFVSIHLSSIEKQHKKNILPFCRPPHIINCVRKKLKTTFSCSNGKKHAKIVWTQSLLFTSSIRCATRWNSYHSRGIVCAQRKNAALTHKFRFQSSTHKLTQNNKSNFQHISAENLLNINARHPIKTWWNAYTLRKTSNKYRIRIIIYNIRIQKLSSSNRCMCDIHAQAFAP